MFVISVISSPPVVSVQPALGATGGGSGGPPRVGGGMLPPKEPKDPGIIDAVTRPEPEEKKFLKNRILPWPKQKAPKISLTAKRQPLITPVVARVPIPLLDFNDPMDEAD